MTATHTEKHVKSINTTKQKANMGLFELKTFSLSHDCGIKYTIYIHYWKIKKYIYTLDHKYGVYSFKILNQEL
jgi:hypothetical protein